MPDTEVIPDKNKVLTQIIHMIVTIVTVRYRFSNR